MAWHSNGLSACPPTGLEGPFSLTLEAMRLLPLAAILAALAFGSCSDDEGPPEIPPGSGDAPYELTITNANGETATLQVEVASTRAQRERGLMERESMPDDHGMLFLFEEDVSLGFWMKNTPLPLTIAYIDSTGEILEMRDGQPRDETILRPSQPYRYALEVNQGWFERNGFAPGDQVTLPANLPAAE